MVTLGISQFHAVALLGFLPLGTYPVLQCLAHALTHAVLIYLHEQVFLTNFVHGDLHPGNLLVGRREDTGGPCLVMLDAGIVCELDEADRKNFIDLFYAIIVGDGKLAGRLMIERVTRTPHKRVRRAWPGKGSA